MSSPVPFSQRSPIASGEAKLVALIRAGDRAAFEELHAAHHDALWRFAYAQVRSAEMADEIVQDVFFALWRKRTELEITSTVVGWLYGAARHHALRRWREERAVVRLTDHIRAHADRSDCEAGDEALLVAMGAACQDSHNMVVDRDLDDAVTQALAGLSERRRVAMTLRWKHQLAGPEIAEVLGTTPEAVRVLLTRARQELSALLRLARE